VSDAPRRGPWWPLAKLVITATLLYLALRRIDVRGALRALGALHLVTIFAIVAQAALQVPIAAQRWRRMLRALGVALPLPALVADYLVGQAFNLLLPSTVGGDVMRGLRCAARSPGRQSEVWLSVLLERLIGLFSS
jgi:glycosyltransferase 2 family protein